MDARLAALAALAAAQHHTLRLEAQLRNVVDHAATALGTPRVSLRLLGDDDELLATCRAGMPLHEGDGARFRRGEGLVGHVAEAGRSLRTGDAQNHPSYVERAGQVAPLGSFLGVPLFDQDEVMGVLAAVDPARDRFGQDDEWVLSIMAAICAPRLSMARLERLARLDALTAVLNRHGLRRTLRSAGMKSSEMSVVLVDLDHFKQVNDTHGHLAGDEVLKGVAEALRGALRGGDIVARVGGEEFLLVLPNTPRGAAALVAERARLAVADLRFEAGGTAFGVTLSAGVAERGEGEPQEGAIARADAALYRAKAGGRDRVEVAPPAEVT